VWLCSGEFTYIVFVIYSQTQLKTKVLARIVLEMKRAKEDQEREEIQKKKLILRRRQAFDVSM
jgi:hypothetical protein